MGPYETTGIVLITMVVIQGLLKLIGHLVDKYSLKAEDVKENRILSRLEKIEETRSLAETQKSIIDKLQKITETQFKVLGIIERLEKRLETLDNRQN